MSAEDQALFKKAKEQIHEAWGHKMRRQGVKVRLGDYSQDHPSMLLKNKNAEVLAGLTTELAPDIRSFINELAANDTDESPFDENEENDLSDEVAL